MQLRSSECTLLNSLRIFLYIKTESKEETCQSCLWCMALQIPSGPWAWWSVYWSTCVLSLPWNTLTVWSQFCKNNSESVIIATHILSLYLIIEKQGSFCKKCPSRAQGTAPSVSHMENKTRPDETHSRTYKKLVTMTDRRTRRWRQTIRAVCNYSMCVDSSWAITPSAAEQLHTAQPNRPVHV